jgi:hypothetical protein
MIGFIAGMRLLLPLPTSNVAFGPVGHYRVKLSQEKGLRVMDSSRDNRSLDGLLMMLEGVANYGFFPISAHSARHCGKFAVEYH